jgi:hypothetical protein
MHAELWNAPTWFLSALTFAMVVMPFALKPIAAMTKKSLKLCAATLAGTMAARAPPAQKCHQPYRSFVNTARSLRQRPKRRPPSGLVSSQLKAGGSVLTLEGLYKSTVNERVESELLFSDRVVGTRRVQLQTTRATGCGRGAGC